MSIQKLWRLLAILVGCTFLFACSGQFNFVNEQPIYLGTQISPDASLLSGHALPTGKKVSGTDSKSAHSSTTRAGSKSVTRTSSERVSVVAARAYRALGNSPRLFIAGSEIKMKEITGFALLMGSSSFSGQVYKIK